LDTVLIDTPAKAATSEIVDALVSPTESPFTALSVAAVAPSWGQESPTTGLLPDVQLTCQGSKIEGLTRCHDRF
jgi:hypothetical protein